jgi:NAD(P)-dependent dehydrogenase (short-subunit alcohol dehydrogenase family)
MGMKEVQTRNRFGVTNLKGQTAFVTGGDSDLGAAICKAFAECQANVVVAARNEPRMEETVSRLKELDADVMKVQTDVLQFDSVKRAVAAVLEKYERIEILVNAAGVTGPVETPLHEIEEKDWDYVVDSNLKGTFLPCKAVVPTMIKQSYGRIVNIAGTSGLRGYVNRAAYSSSKWAVRGLTKTLALEVGKYNINVNAICPGVVEGRRMSNIISKKAAKWNVTDKDVYDKYNSETALGRFSLPEDVARAALFLVGEGGRQITGHEIIVDGGWDV